MKRQGASRPWSGTRAATIRMASNSSAVGPGPVRSCGGTERRVRRRWMISFMVFSAAVWEDGRNVEGLRDANAQSWCGRHVLAVVGDFMAAVKTAVRAAIPHIGGVVRLRAEPEPHSVLHPRGAALTP